MTRTCDELGVCNGRHCTNVAPCPDYDLIACNSGPCDGADGAPCQHAVFECEVPCSPEPPQPTYRFAPGVIQGPDLPIVFMDTDGPWIPMTLADTLKITATVLLLGFVAGYLVERLA